MVSQQLFYNAPMAPKAKQKAKACEASKSRGGYNVDVPAECAEDVMTALVDEAREGGEQVGVGSLFYFDSSVLQDPASTNLLQTLTSAKVALGTAPFARDSLQFLLLIRPVV